MEYSFWLDQRDWNEMMKKSCQVLLSQLPLEKLENDLENYPGEEDEETQQKWVYEYILAYKLVWDFHNTFTCFNLTFSLYRSRRNRCSWMLCPLFVFLSSLQSLWPCLLWFMLSLKSCNITMSTNKLASRSFCAMSHQLSSPPLTVCELEWIDLTWKSMKLAFIQNTSQAQHINFKTHKHLQQTPSLRPIRYNIPNTQRIPLLHTPLTPRGGLNPWAWRAAGMSVTFRLLPPLAAGSTTTTTTECSVAPVYRVSCRIVDTMGQDGRACVQW